MLEESDKLLIVAGDTDAKKLGYVVADMFREGSRVVLRALGFTAVNIAVKSIIHANTTVAAEGVVLAVRPSFQKVEGNSGEEVTAICFRVERVH